MRYKKMFQALLFFVSSSSNATTSLVDALKPKRPRFGKALAQDATSSNTATSDTPLPNNNDHHDHPHHFRLSPFHIEIPQDIKDILQKVHAVLLYKPPVGIIAVLAMARLVMTGRIFRLYGPPPKVQLSDDVLRQNEEATTRQKSRRRKRTLQLDADDRLYETFGGVLRIRTTLCTCALTTMTPEGITMMPSQSIQLKAFMACQITYRAGGHLFEYIEQVIAPLASLEHSLRVNKEVKTLSQEEGTCSTTNSTETDTIIEMATKVAEIRALDSLLRLSRDRLLKTSSRLHRLVKYWNHRVALSSTMGRFLQTMMKESIEGNRMRLAFAQGAYKSEIARLGQVQLVLMDRPEDSHEQDLVTALSSSSTNSAVNQSRRFQMPLLSNYAIRWNTGDGNGRLHFRYYDDSMDISSEEACKILLKGESNAQAWIDDANEWTKRARTAITNILEESIGPLSKMKNNIQEQHVETIRAWCRYDGNGLDAEQNWRTVLMLVDNIAKHRRVGEGRAIGFFDVGLLQWTKRIDVMGIPSSLAAIGVARAVHYYLLPKWPDLKTTVYEGYLIAWGIIEKRFWGPLQGIVQDLMNKRPSLLEAFDVANEEKSLDNMLRDLGFSNGSEGGRKEGLVQAARQYESDLNNGLFRNAMRGRLIRLLLVQIQQLKAGLLSAMESIDVLVDANQLNIQLMAAVPAVLLVTLGTRFFVRSLYSLRSKDIRPIGDVHAQMAELLDSMETRLLLANGGNTALSALTPTELGDFVLDMYTYLVLLDFCSPPFPGRSCESIHKSMQEILCAQGRARGTDRHIALLRLVKQKHMDLLKYF